MISEWATFDGWCSARGVDAITLPLDRAHNLYLFALREHADEDRRDEIARALEPPLTHRSSGGVPSWYGSDEEAWQTFAQASERE